MPSQKERFASSSFSDFTNIRELYRSSAGAVYCARFKYDNCKYVLKERTLPELGKRKDIMNEVSLLSQLDHPNVVRCEGFFRDESRNSLFIVLEYCSGGDLKAIIDNYKLQGKKCLDEKLIWHIFYQICDGLKHLHEHGIVHRDLKTMNIMIIKNDTKFVAKIADLGVSRQLSEDTMMLQTFYGTPLYLSPELVDNKQYNEKTDIWSLGVILYELICLTHPFKSSTLLGLAKLICSGKYDSIPGTFSKSLSRCVRWLLNVDFAKRPNIMQLLRYVSDQTTPGYPWKQIGPTASGTTVIANEQKINSENNDSNSLKSAHDQRKNPSSTKAPHHEMPLQIDIEPITEVSMKNEGARTVDTTADEEGSPARSKHASLSRSQRLNVPNLAGNVNEKEFTSHSNSQIEKIQNHNRNKSTRADNTGAPVPDVDDVDKGINSDNPKINDNKSRNEQRPVNLTAAQTAECRAKEAKRAELLNRFGNRLRIPNVSEIAPNNSKEEIVGRDIVTSEHSRQKTQPLQQSAQAAEPDLGSVGPGDEDVPPALVDKIPKFRPLTGDNNISVIPPALQSRDHRMTKKTNHVEVMPSNGQNRPAGIGGWDPDGLDFPTTEEMMEQQGFVRHISPSLEAKVLHHISSTPYPDPTPLKGQEHVDEAYASKPVQVSRKTKQIGVSKKADGLCSPRMAAVAAAQQKYNLNPSNVQKQDDTRSGTGGTGWAPPGTYLGPASNACASVPVPAPIPTVRVDCIRLQAAHRRETLQLNKLLKIREFLGSRNTNHNNSFNENEKHVFNAKENKEDQQSVDMKPKDDKNMPLTEISFRIDEVRTRLVILGKALDEAVRSGYTTILMHDYEVKQFPFLYHVDSQKQDVNETDAAAHADDSRHASPVQRVNAGSRGSINNSHRLAIIRASQPQAFAANAPTVDTDVGHADIRAKPLQYPEVFRQRVLQQNQAVGKEEPAYIDESLVDKGIGAGENAEARVVNRPSTAPAASAKEVLSSPLAKNRQAREMNRRRELLVPSYENRSRYRDGIAGAQSSPEHSRSPSPTTAPNVEMKSAPSTNKNRVATAPDGTSRRSQHNPIDHSLWSNNNPQFSENQNKPTGEAIELLHRNNWRGGEESNTNGYHVAQDREAIARVQRLDGIALQEPAPDQPNRKVHYSATTSSETGYRNDSKIQANRPFSASGAAKEAADQTTLRRRDMQRPGMRPREGGVTATFVQARDTSNKIDAVEHEPSGLLVRGLYRNLDHAYDSRERLPPAAEHLTEEHAAIIDIFAFNANSKRRFHRQAPISSGAAYLSNIGKKGRSGANAINQVLSKDLANEDANDDGGFRLG